MYLINNLRSISYWCVILSYQFEYSTCLFHRYIVLHNSLSILCTWWFIYTHIKIKAPIHVLWIFLYEFIYIDSPSTLIYSRYNIRYRYRNNNRYLRYIMRISWYHIVCSISIINITDPELILYISAEDTYTYNIG